MNYIGIDPGQSGGIAVISARHEGDIIKTWKMPETERDIWLILPTARSINCFAFIESVHSMPKQGVSSSFKFGQNFGTLLGLLTASMIPFERVTPQKWQKAIGCMSKGDKNVTKRKAQELFPSVKVTHAIADALLIAEYCRRVRSTQ